MTGSEHMLHAGGKASALSSFSLEEQNEIEQSPQRWCGGTEAQRTPPWSRESASEHTQHSTDAIAREVVGDAERNLPEQRVVWPGDKDNTCPNTCQCLAGQIT